MRLFSIYVGVLIALLPAGAWALNLQCVNGFPVTNTSLFGTVSCQGFGPANVFSGLNCQFQMVLNDVMSRMYCGIQNSLMYTLAVAMVLFVIVYAIGFTFGIFALTARDLVSRLIKMALIWSFAMNASWGIGLAFSALVGSIEVASTWALHILDPNVGARNIFYYLDNLLYNQITGSFTLNGAMLIGFIMALGWVLFPLFALFVYLFFTVLKILMRVLISYLMAITLIAFLISLAPVFVSFALFQITFSFFETWLKYLISCALQIVLIMAAVAVWILIMSQFGQFFVNLYNILRVTDFIADIGVGPYVDKGVGVCESTMQYTIFGNRLTCVGTRVVPPTAFVQYPMFIWYLFSNLVTLCIICYTFNTLMEQLPGLARDLAGPKDVPKLYGGSGPGAVQMPGFMGMGKLQTYKDKLFEQGLSGIMGGGNNAIGQFKDQNNQLIAGRR